MTAVVLLQLHWDLLLYKIVNSHVHKFLWCKLNVLAHFEDLSETVPRHISLWIPLKTSANVFSYFQWGEGGGSKWERVKHKRNHVKPSKQVWNALICQIVLRLLRLLYLGMLVHIWPHPSKKLDLVYYFLGVYIQAKKSPEHIICFCRYYVTMDKTTWLTESNIKIKKEY